VVEHGQTGLR